MRYQVGSLATFNQLQRQHKEKLMFRSSEAIRKSFRNRLAAMAFLLVAVPLVVAAATITKSPVFPGGGESTLIRTPSGVSFHMSAPGIPDGHAVTIWAVVFNNPAGCFVPGLCGFFPQDYFPGNAAMSDLIGPVAGRPVNKGKNARFAGNLREGDTSASINPLLFGTSPIGLLDSNEAEIHLVVRSHGPAIPGLIDEQIGSYEGGCVVNLPVGEVPDQVGECGDFIFSIHYAPE